MEFEFLGPYRIDGILGRGGMGTVFKGIHAKTQEPVAIKVIASVLADQERFRRRFAAEVETLKRLSHPNIVQLIGYGEEQGHLFYSMEYVSGESLQEQLREVKSLPWKRVIEICIEICSALKQAHDLGIIHRDLKPANIMINDAGQTKLTDFGIAKLFGSTDVTVAGSVIGTADFMPPEQAEGKGVTTRSDLYAVGSLAYACIAGRAPFVGKSVPEVLYAVRYNAPPPLQSMADVPDELAELIEELLKKDPAARPPTALVVGNRLRALKVGLQKREERSQSKEIIEKAANATEMTSIDLEALGDIAPDLQNLAESSHDSTRVLPRDALRSNPSELEPDQPVPPESDSSQPNTSGNQTNATSLSKKPARNPSTSHSNPIQSSSDKQVDGHGGKGTPRATAHRPPIAGPEESTRVATPSALESDFESDDHSEPVVGHTHFTIVDEIDRRKATQLPEQESGSSDWGHWASIAGLSTALVACIVAFWYFSRPASLESLHSQVRVAIESGDDSQLLDAATIIEEIETRFPDDPKLAEYQPLRLDLDLLKTSKSLMRRARMEGGASNLDPLEQAFLDCIQARNIHETEAAAKIRAFLIVFSDKDRLSAKQQKLIQLAEHMRDQIAKTPYDKTHPAAERLQDQLRWAATSLPQELKPQFYQSVIELYEDKAWAKEVVANAKLALESFKKRSGD